MSEDIQQKVGRAYLFSCNEEKFGYNKRRLMAAKPETTESPLLLKVETAERREVKMESPLFYIVPPLLVLAVFVYCMVATPDVPASPAAKPAAAAARQDTLDMDDFSDEELNVDDAAEEDAEN